MKKLFILLFISLTSFYISSGQLTKVGGGLGFSSGFPFHDMPQDANKSGHFNASAKGIIELSLPIHISPSFTFFIPHITKETQLNESVTTTVSTVMFDLNGHYVFNSLDKFEFYGLAGVDVMLAGKKEITKTTGTTGTTNTVKEKDNAMGLNIGAGTYLKIGEQLDLYAEAKCVLSGKNKLFFSNYNQIMINAGVLINLNWMKKNENPGR